jgi:putative nucleotidyltransferase with HDIG domain
MAEKILYIEDNPDNMNLVKRLLEAEGYEVIGAVDGISGIQKAEAELPQLVLMDLQIPDLDGYDATLKIKSLNGLADVPIIALTAKTSKQDREKALSIGCDGYIPKPIDVDTFPSLIAQYLKGKQDKIDRRKRDQYLKKYSQDLVERLQEKVVISKKSLRELSAMAKLNTIINKSLDTQKVLQASIKHVKGVLQADACAIYELDESRGELLPWSHCKRRESGDCCKGRDGGCCRNREAGKLKLGEGVAGKVVQTGKPLMVVDPIPSSSQDNHRTQGVLASTICTPLILRGETRGALQVSLHHSQKVFSEDDLKLLNLMGSQIAIALENCILYEQVKNLNQELENQVRERTKELSILLDASRAGAASLSLKQVLKVFSQKLVQLIPNTCCRLALLDEKGENLVIKSVYPIRQLNWQPKLGLVMPLREFKWFNNILKSKENVVVQCQNDQIDISPKEKEIIFGGKFKSCLILPLTVNGTKIGIALLHEMRNWQRWPFSQDRIDLCLALSNQMSVYINNAQLYENIRSLFLDTVKALGMAVDQRDPYTSDHSNRVTKYAVLIAQQMKLPPKEIEQIRNASLLHDIGKIGISDQILLKPSKLTPEEFEIIKTHPLRAAKILHSVKQLNGVIPIITHHHERYDGTGYNSKLKGEQIPLGGRILAVADAYEAMTSNRTYKKAIPKQQALMELKRLAGKQFDPQVVDAFLCALDKAYKHKTKTTNQEEARTYEEQKDTICGRQSG